MGPRVFSVANVRWLVAETLVVVLGILIALGLDDYRSARSDNRLALEYVERIQKDVNSDLGYVASFWYPRLEAKRRALESIAPVVRGKSPVPNDVLEFMTDVSLGGVLGTSATAWYTDTTFQDIRATGNLRLIKDPSIRAAISEYYEAMESETRRIERRFTDYVSFVHTVMPGELRDDISMKALEEFGVDYALQRLLSDEFRNLVNQEYNLLLFMESREYEASARSLLEKLDNYQASLRDN